MRIGAVLEPPAGGGWPLWPPLLATRGAGTSSTGHAHHAMHAVLATTGQLRIRVGARGAWQRAAGVLTAPNVAHSLDASGAEILLVFLDPESEAGRSLRAVLGGPVQLLDAAARDRLLMGAEPMALMGEGGAAWTSELVASLGGAPVSPARALHPRVAKLLRHLRKASPDSDTSLPALAQISGLSSSRLMHAFTESIGIPLRQYLAWQRLQRAAAAIVAGRPLADAAYAAGFSDAAHMSRTFRRMLGMSPSMLRPA